MRARPWLTAGLGLMLALAPAGLWAEDFSGAELVNRLGCLACHSAGGPAHPLDHLGSRFSGAELAKIVTNPQKHNGHRKMPSYAFLRPQELQILVDYLAALK